MHKLCSKQLDFYKLGGSAMAFSPSSTLLVSSYPV